MRRSRNPGRVADSLRSRTDPLLARRFVKDVWLRPSNHGQPGALTQEPCRDDEEYNWDTQPATWSPTTDGFWQDHGTRQVGGVSYTVPRVTELKTTGTAANPSLGELADCVTRHVSGVNDPADPESYARLNNQFYSNEYIQTSFEQRLVDIIRAYPVLAPDDPEASEEAYSHLPEQRLFVYYSTAAMHSPLQVTQALLDEVDALRGAKHTDAGNTYWRSCSWLNDHDGNLNSVHNVATVGQLADDFTATTAASPG